MLPILTLFGWSIASYKSISYSSFAKHLPFNSSLKQWWFWAGNFKCVAITSELEDDWM